MAWSITLKQRVMYSCPGGLCMRTTRILLFAILSCTLPAFGAEPRARDLGIPFDGKPGALNAITDVAGVTVGHETLIRDLPDERAVRTGVTAILPRGRESLTTMVYRRLARAERQRRNDRHDLARGKRFSRRPGNDHEHAQHRRSARGRDQVARRAGRRRRNRLLLVTAGGRRDLGRLAERRERLSRARPEHAGKALDAAKPGRWPRVRSAAAPG